MNHPAAERASFDPTVPDPRQAASLIELFAQSSEKLDRQPFMWRKQDGEWRTISWRHTATLATRMAQALRLMGLEQGDRVILLGENRPEWVIANLAILAAGGICVPAYTTQTSRSHQALIEDSGAGFAFCLSHKLLDQLLPAAHDTTLRSIIMIDKPPTGQPSQDAPSLYDWHECLETGKQRGGSLRQLAHQLKRDDLCTIIYSSGTSGVPKGVMLTHGSILCNLHGALCMLDDLPEAAWGEERFLSFLPLSHAYEYTAGQWVPIGFGAQIYFAEGLDRLIANMAETKPTLMTAVPRLYETIRSRILSGLKSQPYLRRAMFNATLALGRKSAQGQPPGPAGRAANAALDHLVRRKVRARFGGCLKAFISGGGPLQAEVGLFLSSLGLRLLQGYGLTEASPVVSVNNPKRNRLDTVGPPMAGVEVKLADDGELMVKGELVMQGYWNQPELTAEVLRDGWLMTGDLAELTSEGLIKITDRKKDLMISSGGENIAPQKIEGLLALDDRIEAAMVYGDGRAHLVALIVAGEDADAPAVEAAIAQANAELAPHERIRRFLLADAPFTIASGELTPSMKIRRHILRERYGARLDALYPRG